MRIPDNASLPLGPAQCRNSPGWPVLRSSVCPGKSLILEVQEADVAQRLRAKAADFQVVLQTCERLADEVRFRREIATLEIKARPPRQNAADVQSFPLNLPEHVRRRHSFRRRRVVRASGSVDVVIAAEESELRRV